MFNQFKTAHNKADAKALAIVIMLSWFRGINQFHMTQVISASIGPSEGANMSSGGTGHTGAGSSHSGKDNSDDEDNEKPEISNNSESETASKEIDKTDAGEGTILNNIGLKDSNPKVDPEDIDLSTGTHEADAATG